MAVGLLHPSGLDFDERTERTSSTIFTEMSLVSDMAMDTASRNKRKSNGYEQWQCSTVE